MLTNSVFFTTTQTPIETVDEAVATLLDGDPVWTLNGSPRCGEVWVHPEALVTVWDRAAAAEAEDLWPGARFEEDLVRPEWRSYRVAGSTTWRRYGNGALMAVPTQVRA
jgi:hypothetical protein